MTTRTERYVDDEQAWFFDDVESDDGSDLTFEPTVTSGAVELACEWVSDPGPTRRLRTNAVGLTAEGWHALRLRNPNGRDYKLQGVFMLSA